MQAQAAGSDQWLTEDAPRGSGRFLGRITRSGERAFYFRYTTSTGERDTLRIGAYHPKGANGGLTVAQARALAAEWRKLYSSGAHDLRAHFARERALALEMEEEARAAAQAAALEAQVRAQAAAAELERRITVQQLFDRWCAVDLQPHRRADGKRAGRKDGGQYAREQFGRYVFPSLGGRAAIDIRKADLIAILDSLKAAGKLRTCNVLLSNMKQMFTFALMREIVERNPLDTVSKRQAGGADTLRERILSTDEIKDLSSRIPCSGLGKRSSAAVWLLLATGARVGELMGAVWADATTDLPALAALPKTAAVKVGLVNTTAGTWHLPTTKNERSHTIHLSAFALAQFGLLAELREVATDMEDVEERLVPWVFPNVAGTGPVDVKSFGKQLSDRQRPADRRMTGRSKKTASLMLSGGRWTAHDLRRTTGTLMASLGVSGDVIDECLNHMIERRVRRTYIRDRRESEQAKAFDALGARLAELLSESTAGSAATSSALRAHRPEVAPPTADHENATAHESADQISRRKEERAPMGEEDETAGEPERV
jgi:integrase